MPFRVPVLAACRRLGLSNLQGCTNQTGANHVLFRLKDNWLLQATLLSSLRSIGHLTDAGELSVSPADLW